MIEPLISFLSKTGQFILCFSILVVLHELGHYIPAKIFKCRVEKFYLFFNPWFSIFKKKIGETEYGLGWVPFGGYVKIAGMIDESMDKNQLNKPIEKYEFRSKPAWQRLIIMLGGVFVNVILAIGIFIMIVYVWGQSYLPSKSVKFGISGTEIALKNGFQEGDQLLSINNKDVEDFSEFEVKIWDSKTTSIQVLRNGMQIDIPITENVKKSVLANIEKTIFVPKIPVILDSATSSIKYSQNSIQFQKGDQIIALNEFPINDYFQFTNVLKKFKETFVQLKALRNLDTIQIGVYVNNNSKIGFVPKSYYGFLGISKKSYSFLESVPKGYNICKNTLNQYIKGIGQIFSGKINPNESLGSVISIGKTFPKELDWERFWTLTAIFSIILAFMNVLPIPALDGGHALFIIIELIIRRKPSDKFMEWAQIVGMVLLMSLMAYALGLDIWRLFK